MKQTITIYCHDGGIRRIEAEATLELVQALVGGLIEAVPGMPDHWCNEEGILLKLPPHRNFPQIRGQIVVAKLD